MPKAKKAKIKPKAKKVVKKMATKKPVKRVKVLLARRSAKRVGEVKKKIKPVKKIAKQKIPKKTVKKVIKRVVVKRTNPASLKLRRTKPEASKRAVKPAKSKKQAITPAKKLARHNATLGREFAAESLFKAKIKVIGIGGGGGSIVSEIGRSLEKATFMVADTDIRALKKKSGIKYFWFGQDLTHGLGTGVNVELGRMAAESAKEKISQSFKDQDIVIFIASLGGGLGSGATQVFADAAREFGGITFGIFTLPFKFEGKNKQRIALNALKLLRQSLNVSLVIPNEKIFKIIDSNTPIMNAFSTVNKSLIESLESLIDLIYNPGIINIDFADLRTILRGRGNTAFLNTTEESGKDRAEKICEKVLTNPLLQNNSFEAEKILFNIAGSENLSMFEVEKISSHIANTNPKAKIIFGISKSPKLKNKIKTTILMTGGAVKDEEVEVKEIVVEKPEPIGFIKENKIEEPIKTEVKKEKLKAKKEVKKPIKPKKNKKQAPKKPQAKKPEKKIKEDNKVPLNKKKEEPVSFVPVFEPSIPAMPIVEQSKLSVVEVEPVFNKKNVRRSGLEIRKAEEQEEKKRIAQEKEWEIPAFLRRVKYKN